METNKLEEGHYWVNYREGSVFEVAYWDGSRWSFCGCLVDKTKPFKVGDYIPYPES